MQRRYQSISRNWITTSGINSLRYFKLVGKDLIVGSGLTITELSQALEATIKELPGESNCVKLLNALNLNEFEFAVSEAESRFCRGLLRCLNNLGTTQLRNYAVMFLLMRDSILLNS